MINQAIIVFLKEMKSILRDKKTFIFGLILPILLVPSMLFIIDFSMKGSQEKFSQNVDVGINNKENSVYTFLSNQPNITLVDVADSKSALDSGKISAYITVGETIDEDVLNKRDYKLNIEYSNSSIGSVMSMPLVGYYEEAYKYIVQNYSASSVDELKALVSFELPYEDPTKDLSLDTSSLYFNMLVPMMLILYCCIGSSSTAADLSAGEKERGTLEALLSTGADRTAIIIGKMFATTAMGMISGLCTVLGLWGYLLISSSGSSHMLSTIEMLTLLIITLFTAMFFASVNLAIGVYSRSFKEAQTYLMPVSILSLIPTYFTYTLEVGKIGISYLSVPIMNIVCIIKEIFAGAVNPIHVGIVIGWFLIYILIAFSVTLRMFKKENIVFRI